MTTYLDEWQEKIAEAKADGMTHSKALSFCAKTYPRLRLAVIAEANDDEDFDYDETDDDDDDDDPVRGPVSTFDDGRGPGGWAWMLPDNIDDDDGQTPAAPMPSAAPGATARPIPPDDNPISRGPSWVVRSISF